MSSNIVTVNDMQKMAEAVAKSNLFGIKTSEQALALMCIAQAENLHPGVVARDYHIINGRPALKADSMLARFQSVGGKVRWMENTDERVCAVFSHPSGGDLEVEWTMERAKKAELSSKDNWKKYPRQMLRARVISEGIRAIFPGVIAGSYSVEEVYDFDNKNGIDNKKISKYKIPIKDSNSVIHDNEIEVINDSTIDELKELISVANLSKDIIDKWLDKAGVECVDEFSHEMINKCVKYLKEKHIK